MKTSEIRDLPLEDIQERLTETKEELFNLRFQNVTGQLDNYKRLQELKKDIARIKTILRERELSGDVEAEG
ncbi:MAG: 50S ribosomal protein L29 [Actinobacteria bacterium]|nr:50S ribosomal protein L29 [Actinomycetota bacterium]